MTKLSGFQDANYGTLKTLNLGILFVLDVINIALFHLFILFMVSQCTYKIQAGSNITDSALPKQYRSEDYKINIQ